MYRSNDGSLHAIKGEAELRDKCVRFRKLMRDAANLGKEHFARHDPMSGMYTVAESIARHNPDKLDALIAVLEGEG